MHLPAHLCRSLYRIHPQLRFAWVGREKAYEGELNPGSFAVVQLYHNRDAGTPDYPNTFREFWDVGFIPDMYGAPILGPVSRGPIFSRNGSLRRDWDPLQRSPMLISVLDGYKPQDEFVEEDGDANFSHYDVFSGRVLLTIRQWLLSPYARFVHSAKQKGKEFRSKVQNIAHEASSELWADANKSDTTSVTLAKKHQKDDLGVQQLNAWKDRGGSASIEESFMPPPLPKVA